MVAVQAFGVSSKRQQLALAALAFLVGFLRRVQLWRLNRRLPKGLRYKVDGPLGSNGHYEVTSLALIKQHAKALVHPTAGARVYMGGLREANILCSPANVYEQQRAIVHPFITGHAGQYLKLLQNTELVFQAPESGEVDMLEEAGRYVAHISTAAMGLELRHGFRWRNVNRAVLGVGMVLGVGLSERLLKFVIRLFLPFSDLEQQIAEFVDKSDSSFVRELTTSFGRHEAIGHIWGVVNGSIIPETNMICSIMRELGANPAAQEAVHEMIREDTAETLPHNKAFDGWVLAMCREHAFFRSTSRVAEEDFIFEGQRVPKGSRLRIPIARLNESAGASLTWGFGRRSCPGAQIGRNTVKYTVFRILRSYRVGLAREPFNLKTDTVNIFPFGLRMTCTKRATPSPQENAATQASLDELQ